MEHLFFLTVVTKSESVINLTVAFERKRPTYEDLMSIYDKYNLKIINQITYIGKRKEEPLGFIERETVFKYMGITYVRVPAQEARSCKGCAFKDIDCSTTKMPNRPACSDWIYRVKIA